MNKAILVIDMPKCCEECLYCDGDFYGDRECLLINKYLIEDDLDKKRSFMCPLKPMPQKDADMGEADDSWTIGWNDCIDEILGETEC